MKNLGECSQCGRRVKKPRETTDWFFIAGPQTGYPSFCSRRCLAAYVRERFEVAA